MATITVTHVEHETQWHHGKNRGTRAIYTVMRGGVTYLVHAPWRDCPWEVARISFSERHIGAAWTWGKDLTKGAWLEVLTAAKERMAANDAKAQQVEDATAAEYVAETARMEAPKPAANLFEQMTPDSRDALASVLGFDVDSSTRGAHVLFRQRLRETACLPEGFTVGDALEAYLQHLPRNPVRVSVSLSVSDQFLRDVLCTACEGGSNYWAGMRCVKAHEGEYGQEWETVSVRDHGEGDGTQAIKVIGLPELRQGVRIMLERGKCADSYKATLLGAVVADDASDVDSELADLVLQSTFFDGEVVYG